MLEIPGSLVIPNFYPAYLPVPDTVESEVGRGAEYKLTSVLMVLATGL